MAKKTSKPEIVEEAALAPEEKEEAISTAAAGKKRVVSGQIVELGEEGAMMYLDTQTHIQAARGTSMTRLFFRRMSDDTMQLKMADDPVLEGFDFIKPGR